MTNHPGYSPPPQQPGYRPASNQPVPPAYAQGHQPPYNQQFDWRYQQGQPQYRQPYEPFGGTGPGPGPAGTGTGSIPTATGSGPIPGGTGPIPLRGGTGPVPMPGMYPPMGPPPGVIRERRPRAGMLAIGALTIAVVSAGIGGAAATLVELNHLPGGINGGTVAAANMPPGSVEQVAAKVVPSVVMLETDLGRQSEEGSGVILSADGLILTNNHVIAAAAKPPAGAPPPKTT